MRYFSILFDARPPAVCLRKRHDEGVEAAIVGEAMTEPKERVKIT